MHNTALKYVMETSFECLCTNLAVSHATDPWHNAEVQLGC